MTDGVPLTAKQVMRRLGISPSMLHKLQDQKRLLADVKMGSEERLYEESTVQKYILAYRSQLATIDEIATALHRSRHNVNHHMVREMAIKHDAMRRQHKVYGADKIVMAARARGWIEVLDDKVQGYKHIWLTRREDGTLLTIVGLPETVLFQEGDPYGMRPDLADQIAHRDGDAL